MHVACMVLLALLSRAEEFPTSLRWKLAPGETLRLQMRVETLSASAVDQLLKKIASNQQMRLSWHVEGTDREGNFQIIQRIEQLRWRLEGEEGRVVIDFDSDAAPTDSTAQAATASISALVGKSLRVVMSPRGEIISATPEADLQKAIEALETKDNLLFVFSAEGLALMLAQALPMLPDQDVAPGDRWQHTRRLALAFGTVTQQSEFTLAQPAEAQSATGHVPIELKSQIVLEPGEQVTLKIIEQQTQGKLVFDSVRGRYVSADVRQALVTETPFRDTSVKARVETHLQLSIEPSR